MHTSFTWKSHQEKSGQYDVKAENVLVDISVNMFSCCRVMSLRLSVSARGKRLDHFLACVSWVKYNDIRVGFQHIVSNINRVIQTCSSAHHPTSPSVGKGLIYMATFKICHLRGDVTKTDVRFLKEHWSSVFFSHLTAEGVSLLSHRGHTLFQIIPCNCWESCDRRKQWDPWMHLWAQSDLKALILKFTHCVRLSLPCSMIHGNSTYTVTGLLLLGTNTLSCG